MNKTTITGNWPTKEVFINGKKLGLEKSLKVYNHSPTGFSWGYAGSGPAQLALAICLELMPKEEALQKYQDFKWQYIAKLPQNNFKLELD